jgi:hypothetical protein
VTIAAVVDALPSTWRARAEELRHYGADAQARALEAAAEELEVTLRANGQEPLRLADAARESGYSAEHLAREIRQGRIPNAGRSRAPRIRRADLPRKPGTLPNQPAVGIVSREQIARSVVTSYQERNDG